MSNEKQIAALISAGADPVLVSKMTTFPAPRAAAPAKPEPVVEEPKVKERKSRKKGD